MEPTIKIALVGAGMFGGDVHLRAYADLQRFGIAGQLARVGLDKFNREDRKSTRLNSSHRH